MMLKKNENINHKMIEDLYKDINQSLCLMAINIPFEGDKADSYIEALNRGEAEGRRLISYGIYEEEEMIGKVEVIIIDKVGELDLVIKDKYINKGQGTKALNEFTNILKEHKYCEKVEAYINEDNKAMQAVLEKCNFIKGRSFKANLMREDNGIYQIKDIKGIEYYKELEKKA